MNWSYELRDEGGIFLRLNFEGVPKGKLTMALERSFRLEIDLESSIQEIYRNGGSISFKVKDTI